jgi:hypothetical protein
MKMNYTLSEYIDNPLSKADVAEFRKREKIEARYVYGIPIILTFIAMFYIPVDMLFGAVSLFAVLFIVMMSIIPSISKIKKLNILDDRIVTVGYSGDVDFLEDYLRESDIPEIVLLRRNVESIGRPLIQLERSIMHRCYTKALSAQMIEDELKFH